AQLPADAPAEPAAALCAGGGRRGDPARRRASRARAHGGRLRAHAGSARPLAAGRGRSDHGPSAARHAAEPHPGGAARPGWPVYRRGRGARAQRRCGAGVRAQRLYRRRPASARRARGPGGRGRRGDVRGRARAPSDPHPVTAARPRPRKLALVLGGGGALGAFEAGLYEALAEAGLQPDWLAGSSIGAFNAVLIAGNPPERRIERLREFWSLLAQPAVEGPEWGGDARRVRKAASALGARLFGRPGMYAPALPQLFLAAPRLGQPSLYDTTPALDTLRRLVDFARIEGGEPRVTINLTDLISGDSVLIDSARARLRPEHLLASMGLLPEFPPIEIDGRWFCD